VRWTRSALLAVALTDVLSDGLSMVYSFFDPQLSARSLGTVIVLDHVARVRATRSGTSASQSSIGAVT